MIYLLPLTAKKRESQDFFAKIQDTSIKPAALEALPSSHPAIQPILSKTRASPPLHGKTTKSQKTLRLLPPQTKPILPFLLLHRRQRIRADH